MSRGVWPYLAWFEGGVLENQLRGFTQLDDEVWERIRGELVATALIQLEEIPGFNSPFLRFHPTLTFAARPYGATCGTILQHAMGLLRQAVM